MKGSDPANASQGFLSFLSAAQVKGRLAEGPSGSGTSAGTTATSKNGSQPARAFSVADGGSASDAEMQDLQSLAPRSAQAEGDAIYDPARNLFRSGLQDGAEKPLQNAAESQARTAPLQAAGPHSGQTSVQKKSKSGEAGPAAAAPATAPAPSILTPLLPPMPAGLLEGSKSPSFVSVSPLGTKTASDTGVEQSQLSKRGVSAGSGVSGEASHAEPSFAQAVQGSFAAGSSGPAMPARAAGNIAPAAGSTAPSASNARPSAGDAGNSSVAAKGNSSGDGAGPGASAGTAAAPSAARESRPATAAAASGQAMPTTAGSSQAFAPSSPEAGVGPGLGVTPGVAPNASSADGAATLPQAEASAGAFASPPAPAAANPHAILDAAGVSPDTAGNAVWQISPTRVEAGFADSQNSWISVVAQRQEGHITAALELSAQADKNMLQPLLPQLTNHLAERQVQVDQIGVSARQELAAWGGGTGGSSSGQEQQSGSQPERAPQAPPLPAPVSEVADLANIVPVGGSRISFRA